MNDTYEEILSAMDISEEEECKIVEAILKDHRKEGITCPADCFCWDIEKTLLRVQSRKEE